MLKIQKNTGIIKFKIYTLLHNNNQAIKKNEY